MNLPDPSLPWPVPMAAVALIAEAEGCRLRAYKCPAGVWTCGWGATDGVQPGMMWSQQQADQRLCADLTKRTAAVEAMLTEHADPNQLGALVSLAYNIGTGALAKSTVLKAHNRGDFQAAARAFGLWNKAKNPRTGKLEVLDGLTSRRARESALYLTPETGTVRTAQAVEAESSLVRSPIAQGSAVTVGAGVVTAATQLGPVLQEVTAAADGANAALAPVKGALGAVRGLVASVADFIGVSPGGLLAITLIAVGFWILSKRREQRREGWS